MAVINGYTGWSSHCNKVILDSTTITTGESAIRTDELDSGLKRTRLRGNFCPDKYSVVMEFDWYNKDSNGKTEYQYFLEWYKYSHKFGTVPFEFPSIIYSPQTGIKVLDSAEDNTPTYHQAEYYKITSAVEGSKSGTFVQIKMTWETVYGGIISYIESTDVINSVSAVNGCLTIEYETLLGNEPASSEFTLYIDNVVTTKTGFFYNSKTLKIWFASITTTGSHTVTFACSSSHLTVAKDTYQRTVTVSAS